ncbi:MAG: GIY-YIG nuclease family protein [Pseudomonadota bacterium]
MADPFTIRVFVPDGDPEGVRIVDRLNWTGLGIVFPRSKWESVREMPEIKRTGVYILVGFAGDSDDNENELPTIYVGQSDDVCSRIGNHFANKDFWDWGVAFVSSNAGLNRAHVMWLEHALIKQATEAKRCLLDNGNVPQEPALSANEKAEPQAFLKEVLQILPLVGTRAFEIPKAVATPSSPDPIATDEDKFDVWNTIVVPAQAGGFEKTFLGEDCWYAIRIAGGSLDQIKYIAAYRTHPISAVTHYAPVSRIEPYGDSGKYKVVFAEPAKEIGPIPYGDAPPHSMRGPRYTTFRKLLAAKQISDLGGGAGVIKAKR